MDHSEFISELATRDDSIKPPWNKIGEAPTEFFSSDCFPDNFKFQDPSRMGSSVKCLLKHLRERQEIYGVNAFHFRNVYQGKRFHPAAYPADAQEVIDAGINGKTWPSATTTREGQLNQHNFMAEPTTPGIMSSQASGGGLTPALIAIPSPTSEPTVAPAKFDMSNIDPALRLPEGDPFLHLQSHSIKSAVDDCSVYPTATRSSKRLQIKPPIFSPVKIAGQTPLKRKKSSANEDIPFNRSPSKRKLMEPDLPQRSLPKDRVTMPQQSPTKCRHIDSDTVATPKRSQAKRKCKGEDTPKQMSTRSGRRSNKTLKK